MCRFLVFKGAEPIQVSHLVTRPRHSITNQAFDSKLRNPSSRPFNADGFGIGWYDALPPAGAHTITPHQTTSLGPAGDPTARQPQQEYSATLSTNNKPSTAGEPERSRTHPSDPKGSKEEEAKAKDLLRKREEERELENERPCLFKSISPAWSNANLTRLAEKIRSPLVFAHVRASTLAGAPSEDNCHPWIFGKLMWMHNGEINSFHKIKRALQSSLPDELYLYPSGYTDSEWAFMLFLSMLKDPHARDFTHVELRHAMFETIKCLNAFAKAAGVDGPSLLNFVVTDGASLVATRYVSSRVHEASSLFFSSGTSFDEYQEGGLYRMTKADKRENIIMIASEPLTFERSDWQEVRTNTMIVVTPKMNLLQIPIIDEYWVQPTDPAAHHRSTDFAVQMGYGFGFQAAQASKEVAA